MSREIFPFPGGIHITTHKELSDDKKSLITPLPEILTLPLHQHIGAPSRPLVKNGDRVLKGQPVARADGYVSVPLHASTSGKVIDIGNYTVPDPLGLKAPCIVIEPDGEDKWFDIKPTENYDTLDPEVLQAVIREAGIVGLGGAGFPAHAKLREGVETAVDTLIINGCECEPYISCDDRLIREKPGYIVAGTRMIQHAVQAKHCVIALEEDMVEAHAALKDLVGDDIELVTLPEKYPQGGERQLIMALTGIAVKSGKLPIDSGVLIHNAGTAAAAYRAVTRGEPLVSRYVTVSGEIDDPRNLQVLIGTPVIHCAQQCGYQSKAGEVIILGGPMMGMVVNNMQLPVIKTTNCVLVTSSYNKQPEMPCIRCGQCVDVCPAELLPQQLYWHARAKDQDRLREYHLFDCIECGCCSYVCPSNIPLVQYYRKAKRQISQDEQTRNHASHARERFYKRKSRLEKNKQEQTSHSGTTTDHDSSMKDKQELIRAAVVRTRAKRANIKQSPDDQND